ncbi:flagellin N-terminal helical domain-containing protein [Kineosporia rhizophila]|uniref:flagellin N-terminal helical domain-containing protein n=1 Tax=Kineosporia rhizophila TaxID=84633 RepID=UPI0022B7E4A6|nr:flagellin [Kineosporia rhizophila]
MGMYVTSNVAALNAYRNLSATQTSQSSSLEKLSSGYRINRAADDAAGLAISQGMQAQIGGLNVAVRNAQDAISVVQTADGALNETQAILQRMRNLAVQAASTGSQGATGAAAAQTEFDQLGQELTRISSTTTFNGQALLSGAYNGTFQVGANEGQAVSVEITTQVDSATLGVDGLDLATGAAAAITTIDNALNTVSTTRATLGAYQNRFQHTVNNLNVAVENMTASNARIQATDMASEMVSFTQAQILSQAGTAMLAQANQQPQSILKLLQ